MQNSFLGCSQLLHILSVLWQQLHSYHVLLPLPALLLRPSGGTAGLQLYDNLISPVMKPSALPTAFASMIMSGVALVAIATLAKEGRVVQKVGLLGKLW